MEHTHSFLRDDKLSALPSEELAIRQLPLRAIVALDILSRCEGRLHVAAKMQGLSTAALSTQITRLETALGIDVVKGAKADRRRFELTAEGQHLVEAFRSALPALVNLSASLRDATGSTGATKRRCDIRRRRPARAPRRPAAT
jgi:DNA-binding transcriptional LysR family regulator